MAKEKDGTVTSGRAPQGSRLGRVAWLSAMLTLGAWGHAAATSQIAFEHQDMPLGGGPGQVVLTGFLLGGVGQDIAVIDALEEGARNLRIFASADGQWAPAIEARLPAGASFVDVLNIAGRERLIVHRDGRVSWFDPESRAVQPLASVPVAYAQMASRELFHLDVSRDLNGDGREDLAVPQGDAFQVLLQRSDGEFSAQVAIGPSAGVGRLYELDGYRLDPWALGRVHQLDYNLDGRADLVYWNGERFAAHLHEASGDFAAEPGHFSVPAVFDSDELTWLAQGTWDFSDGTALRGRVLHSLDDVDGDGIGDLAVIRIDGDSLFDKHTAYEVRFGARGAEGVVVFGQAPDAVVPSDGMQLGMTRHDIDGDGGMDLMFTNFDPSFWKAAGKIIGGLLMGGVSFDVEIYRLAGRMWPEAPDARFKVRAKSPSGEPPGGLATALRSRAKGEPSHPRPPYPSVLLGDVTGDGRAELLVQRKRDVLHVFEGTDAPGRFRDKPHKVPVAMPADHEFTWLADLNADGKQDVLMHHVARPPAADEDDAGVAANQVTILLSR